MLILCNSLILLQEPNTDGDEEDWMVVNLRLASAPSSVKGEPLSRSLLPADHEEDKGMFFFFFFATSLSHSSQDEPQSDGIAG